MVRLGRLRFAQSLLITALALASGCSGCNQKPTEAPTRWLSQAAEIVVEIPDITAPTKKNALLRDRVEGIITKEQYDAAVGEVKRVLGFDPTTAEGLAAAGLPASGAVAGEIIEGGRGGFWVIPCADKAKLEKTITDVIKSRSNIDETKDEAIEGGKLLIFLSSWGTEKVPVAAFTIQKGYAFVGAGKKAAELVKQALVRKKEESLEALPAYASLVKSTVPDAVVRILVPQAKVIMDRLGPDAPKEGFAAAVESTAWSITLDEKSLAVIGRVRFTPAVDKDVQAMFSAGGKVPPGVLATLSPEAVLTVLGAGDVTKFLAGVAPPSTQLGRDVENVFTAFKSDTGLDVRTQIIPAMSGHSAFAIGIGDLKGLSDVRTFLMTPAKFLWSSTSLGLKSAEDGKKLSLMSKDLDPAFERRGLVREQRKLKDLDVEMVKLKTPLEGQDPLLMESAVVGGAWIITNTAGETERAMTAAATAGTDPLGGKGGAIVELRVAPLAAAIRAVDLAQLAGGAEGMIIRTIVGRALALMDRLSKIEARIEPAGEGVLLSLRLNFAPVKK